MNSGYWRLMCSVMVALFFASGCGTEVRRKSAAEIQSELVTTTLSYQANNQFFVEWPTCGTTKHILLKEPSAAGSYPVLIFLTGTWGIYNDTYPDAILTEAANQGFVAASIDYQVNSISKMCEENGWYKTRCMFSTTFHSQSALAAICARPQADCTRGVVVVGHSQGGAHAAMARNFDTRIRGAWTMGFVSRHWDGAPQPCMDEGAAALGTATKRMLKNDRLRVFRGGNEGIDIAWSNQTVGQSCATGTTNCLVGANNSGWYYPPNEEVNFAVNPNKHCFMENNAVDAFGNKKDCNSPHTVDPTWAAVPPAVTYPSGLYSNLQWLKNTILPLGNQP